MVFLRKPSTLVDALKHIDKHVDDADFWAWLIQAQKGRAKAMGKFYKDEYKMHEAVKDSMTEYRKFMKTSPGHTDNDAQNSPGKGWGKSTTKTQQQNKGQR